MRMGADWGRMSPFSFSGIPPGPPGSGTASSRPRPSPASGLSWSIPASNLHKIGLSESQFRIDKRIINYSIPRFSTVEDLIGGLTNDLEKVTVSRHPVLDHIKNLLMENGARGALMSGSGPTVFGIFTDEESALRQRRIWGKGTGGRCSGRTPCKRTGFGL